MRHDPELASADVAAAVAGCLLAQGRPADALAPLDRALAAERDWPLHHWNLAAALHALGDAAGSVDGLRRFVATSATPSGLDADPDQPGRLALAERLIAELERTARLARHAAAPRRARSRDAAAKFAAARRLATSALASLYFRTLRLYGIFTRVAALAAARRELPRLRAIRDAAGDRGEIRRARLGLGRHAFDRAGLIDLDQSALRSPISLLFIARPVS